MWRKRISVRRLSFGHVIFWNFLSREVKSQDFEPAPAIGARD
jgi:hypothetical protein